jgi:hypothetical protein
MESHGPLRFVDLDKTRNAGLDGALVFKEPRLGIAEPSPQIVLHLLVETGVDIAIFRHNRHQEGLGRYADEACVKAVREPYGKSETLIRFIAFMDLNKNGSV